MAGPAAARREQIVDAAVDLFGRHGFRATSVAAVAKAVGVTDAGVLYHFGTKDELLVAVVERLAERHWDAIDRALAPGGIEAIRSLAGWGRWMEANREHQALLVVLSAEHLQDDSKVNAYFRERYRRLVGRLTKLFRSAAASGEIRPDVDARTEAVLFVSMLDGVRLQWLLTDGKVSMRRAVAHYVDELVRRLDASTLSKY